MSARLLRAFCEFGVKMENVQHMLSGASMHMISKKDLSDAELDTLEKLCSLTTVVTANGEVQTHEEANLYVKELDMFLTVKVLKKHVSNIVARKASR